jgi:predicted membrane protein
VVRLGAGESDLDLDSLTLTGVDVRMGAGKTTVDLSGDYTRNFDATIEGGVGQATILLPSEIGVKAKAQGGLGKINAKGLKKVGDSYVNDAYGESDTNISVDVKGGVGEINLKVV